MKQLSPETSNRNQFIALCVQWFLASTVCLLALGMLSYPFWKDRWEDHRYNLPFNSADWKANANDINKWWPTRLRMEKSLLKSGALTGKKRAEILELLGPPPSPWDRHKTKQKPGRLTYYLGPQRGLMRIDCEFLDIYLDSQNRVEKYVIRND